MSSPDSPDLPYSTTRGAPVLLSGRIIALCLLVSATANCAKNETGEKDGAEKACIERGIAYYKEIGSFPTLSTGEDAAKKVRERCARSVQAFPE